MLLDALQIFSEDQALTATGASTNIIDLGNDADIGPGRNLYVVTQVGVAADGSSGNETYVVTLQTDDNSAFSSPTDIASVTIPRGTAAGEMFTIGFPANNERYLRINYALGGTSPSVTVTAFLSDTQPPQHRVYPDAD
jgi:hypothetical protein